MLNITITFRRLHQPLKIKIFHHCLYLNLIVFSIFLQFVNLPKYHGCHGTMVFTTLGSREDPANLPPNGAIVTNRVKNLGPLRPTGMTFWSHLRQ